VEEDVLVACRDHPEGILRLKVLVKGVWGRTRFTKKNFKANSSNTLLIDSSPESSILNPTYNAIFPVPYAGSSTDDFLHASLIPYLVGLLESGQSVTQYLSKKPPDFGKLDETWLLSRLGRKVRKLARLLDNSLVFDVPEYVGAYYMNRTDNFLFPSET